MTVSTLAPRARRRMQPPEPPDPVTQYALDVVAGRVLAGVLVRKACERHLADLATGHERGLSFDRAAAQHAIDFFPMLRHYKGEWGPHPGKPQGDPIILQPWQQFIVGSAFGWKRADGTRRFREVYIEVARKNGKTLMAAGLAIMLAFFDGEPGAEVYSIATKRDQAKLVWNDAKRMVQKNKALANRIHAYALSLADERTASFFRPLGRDSGESDIGTNPFAAVVDELHVLEERESIDSIETGVSARRQPLIIKITTAGVKRESVWAEERADAVAVVEGRATDDAMLVLIYTLDTEPQRASLGSYAALRWMIQSCTCRPRDTASTRSPASTTLTGHRSPSGSVTPVIDEGSESETPSGRDANSRSALNGPSSILNESERLTGAGRRGTRGGRSSATDSTSSGSHRPNTTGWSSSKIHAVGSAGFNQTVSALITITSLGQFEDFCASNATARSASWEIVKRVYFEHSPTCAVTEAQLRPNGLEVELPGDDPLDEAVWPKSNPNLEVSVKLDQMREAAEKARRSPAKLGAFLRFRVNVPTPVGTRALDIDEWDANAGNPEGLDYEEWVAATIAPGSGGYGGLDLASVKDLTALIVVFRSERLEAALEHGCIEPGQAMRDDCPHHWYDVLCRFYCPEDGVRERARRDNVPYDDWVRDGWLIATPGNVTDYRFIRQDVSELAETYVIGDIGFDKWNATQLVLELMDDGATCTAIPQTHSGLGPAWRELDKIVLDHAMRHGGHPILRWMAGNVEVETDAQGNQKPSKRLSKERIDGMVGLDMAINRWLAHGDAPAIWTAA